MTGPIRNVLLIALAFAAFNDAARAHFSYSDPRIVLVMERDGDAVVLIRMPAPLPLLPEDWQGADDTRVPPFGMTSDDAVVLDPAALSEGNDDLRDVLRDSITLQVDGQQIGNRVERYRFHSDAARPRFGTRKSALAAFDAPYAPSDVAKISYFDLTLDVMIRAPDVRISEDVRLTSSLGHSFRVIEKLGTVVKLHRSEGTETQASLGVLDVSFPGVLSQPEVLARAALIGAEHTYRGLDHLAIIVLIAIAAGGLWQALGWASAFTLGHMATLVAGLYGVAPSAAWFIPAVEFAIALSILAACVAVLLGRNRVPGHGGLLVIGLIHGYGFAASATGALFAGEIDPLELAAFALGLELCQFAVYGLVLPVVLMLDRAFPSAASDWRRAVAFVIVGFAGTTLTDRVGEF